MDQLYNNDSPAFTTWMIENDLLKEPFVVIDVGVQGGPHSCWKHLKDKVRVYGFDAIPEVVEALNAQKQANEVYFATALGDEEGTRDFYVRSEIRTTEVPFTNCPVTWGPEGTPIGIAEEGSDYPTGHFVRQGHHPSGRPHQGRL
jgi:hypothetical protein